METLLFSIQNHIAQVIINRPHKANALDAKSWEELQLIFEQINDDDSVRVVIISGGDSKHFCAGIDLSLLMSVTQNTISCEGKRREKLRKQIIEFQSPINAIENCIKPVLVAIHGGCIGAGVDLICAADMRYCTNDTYFTIKEIDMGMVADLGTLQRLPKLINPSVARELAFTGRAVAGIEAQQIGLVNKAFESREELDKYVWEIATQIASKSPVAIRGTKHILNYSLEHSTRDSLEYMATWNAAMLLSNDLQEAFLAQMQKRSAKFED